MVTHLVDILNLKEPLFGAANEKTHKMRSNAWISSRLKMKLSKKNSRKDITPHSDTKPLE